MWYPGARGTLIHEKTWSWKSRVSTWQWGVSVWWWWVCTLPPVLIHTSRPETNRFIWFGKRDAKNILMADLGCFTFFYFQNLRSLWYWCPTDTAKYQGVKSTKPIYTRLFLPFHIPLLQIWRNVDVCLHNFVYLMFFVFYSLLGLLCGRIRVCWDCTYGNWNLELTAYWLSNENVCNVLGISFWKTFINENRQQGITSMAAEFM